MTYVGVVEGAAKDELLASAAALVLASHSESFGMVVAEALAHGTPVVTTKGCPWEVVDEVGAGYQVDPNAAAIAAAIERVLTQPDGGAAMHRAAQELARSFLPGRVGASMKQRYAELIGERG